MADSLRFSLGYAQLLCSKGHLREFDVRITPTRCDCGEAFVWANVVDASSPDQVQLTLLVGMTFRICNFGHTHVDQERRYKIPTSKDTICEGKQPQDLSQSHSDSMPTLSLSLDQTASQS